MSSMMEFMEKTTPLNKKYDRKKGMTLVEIMAAIAILSILFVGISSYMLNIVKAENRSKQYLDTTNYLKAALDVFKLKAGGEVSDSSDTRKYYIEKDKFDNFVNKDFYVYFDDMEEMLKKLTDATVEYSNVANYTTKYELNVNVSKVTDKELYLVKVEMNYGGSIDSKELYINR